MNTSFPKRPSRAARGLAFVLAALAAQAVQADPLSDDKRQALGDFTVAYRLAELWPQMVPKIARDSLPRLEDATRADIDADTLPDDAHRAAAQARVGPLLPAGRKELEAALLQKFDADELATWTAIEIYGRYFETQEIREITKFFSSDTGQKVTTLGPALIAEARRPGAGDVMARHFSEAELAEITAFWRSPVGLKMSATTEQVREDMHTHFAERSEAVVQAVARKVATAAEADAASAPEAAASR
jgi:uncharacterized protein